MSSQTKRDYEVGHSRPPKDRQFKKGRSGNPRGRPKGSKNQKLVFQQVMAAPVRVREGDKQRSLGSYEAMLYAQRQKVLQGDTKAFGALMAERERLGAGLEEEDSEALLTTVHHTAIEVFLRRRGFNPDDVLADHPLPATET